jgi:hypothetical protein
VRGRGRRRRREGAQLNCERIKGIFFTAVKGIYTFTTRSLRVRSGISGKPGLSGQTPEIPLPLNPASRFSRNLIVERFGGLYM